MIDAVRLAQEVYFGKKTLPMLLYAIFAYALEHCEKNISLH